MKKLFLTILLLGISANLYSQPEIKSIEGYLFYNQDQRNNNSGGTYSENIIDNDNFWLFNVVIGEGGSESPSNNTLVIVKLVDDIISTTSYKKIKLTVFDEKNKIIFQQKQEYSILEENNIYFAPFLLYDTGCEALKLRAEIIDEANNTVSVLEKNINFICDE